MRGGRALFCIVRTAATVEYVETIFEVAAARFQKTISVDDRFEYLAQSGDRGWPLIHSRKGRLVNFHRSLLGADTRHLSASPRRRHHRFRKAFPGLRFEREHRDLRIDQVSFTFPLKKAGRRRLLRRRPWRFP
jgi:hypothetical protein